MEEWNEALRYDYPLTSDSVVIDVGGFEGNFAQGLYSKYACNIFVFEPVYEFYEIIRAKFINNVKVQSYNYGLGVKDETVSLSVRGSGTSVLDKSEENIEHVEIKDIAPIVSRFDKIDILKLNIEGLEYDLLDYIIKKGLQTKLVNIQIQFHVNVTEHKERRQRIREALSKTHYLTYDYEYTWENWRLK